ncbi:hypothetical protein [Sporosarcina beigongshangi]|uniref:hypothetical protein n=1 Tax=Sporosarcina beigongshangi TaxID=2782538 RepID=UPI00193983D6|nr:hypothetical protein [Sporosarcina beigongshangi]
MSKQNEIVVMTKWELEEMIERACYKAANKATSSLFNGLAQRFFFQQEENIGKILYEIEEMNH